MKNLAKIEGIATAQLDTTGQIFVEKIVEFCNKNKIAMDVSPVKGQMAKAATSSSQTKVIAMPI